MDNVISFNNAKAKQEQESCENTETCPHCEQQDSAITNFLSRVEGLGTDSDEFIDEVETLIGFVELYTRRETLAEIAHGIIHEIQHIDGDCDEEDED